ncbi:MAG: NAD-dependent epimerase/dehydratase family protein, partial [Mycobacterium sp.]|nr:NAD-dependent epimerase/dehydratase family protein [Mycobacterium sp.]
CASGASDYICFTSSISVYGPTEAPKSELDSPSPNSDYGRSKLMAERIHQGWLDQARARRLTIIRPAAVFGPGENGNFTRLARALRASRFMYAGRTDVIKSCGYVDDLVRAMEFAEQLRERQILFNFCNPKQSDIQEICQAFHEVAGYRMPRTIPKTALAIGIRALRAVNPHDKGTISAARITKLITSTNIVPQVLQGLGFEWQTDLLDGIRAWYWDSETAGFE